MNLLKSTSVMNLTKKLSLAFAFAMMIPVAAICQGIPGPGDGGTGGSPDGVPFDSNMNLIFLAIGLLFAAVVVIKQVQKKKATA